MQYAGAVYVFWIIYEAAVTRYRRLMIREASLTNERKGRGRYGDRGNLLTLIYNWNRKGWGNECGTVRLRPPIWCAAAETENDHLCLNLF